jgi:hypothetical protein
MAKLKNLLYRIKHRREHLSPRRQRAQSFVELALILPILLVMVLGLIEVVFFIGRYLDMLDLTREAARFASVRDPFSGVTGDQDCSTPDLFEFFYDTACVFSPPTNSSACTDLDFCNGMNANTYINSTVDDVVISVYTVNNNRVTNIWPGPNGYWAFSDHDADALHNSNWQRDCQGNVVATSPYFTTSVVNNSLSLSAPPNEGFVAVEFYYCYEQVLALPMFTIFVPNPMRIHAYTLMPLPAAAPSPTPKP